MGTVGGNFFALPQHANTPAVVTVAAQAVLEGKQMKEPRLALNAVGPRPIRATKVVPQE